MNTRKVFKTGHSIAITIPQNMGLLVGDVVMVDRVGESNTIIITKIVKEATFHER